MNQTVTVTASGGTVTAMTEEENDTGSVMMTETAENTTEVYNTFIYYRSLGLAAMCFSDREMCQH